MAVVLGVASIVATAVCDRALQPVPVAHAVSVVGVDAVERDSSVVERPVAEAGVLIGPELGFGTRQECVVDRCALDDVHHGDHPKRGAVLVDLVDELGFVTGLDERSGERFAGHIEHALDLGPRRLAGRMRLVPASRAWHVAGVPCVRELGVVDPLPGARVWAKRIL